MDNDNTKNFTVTVKAVNKPFKCKNGKYLISFDGQDIKDKSKESDFALFRDAKHYQTSYKQLHQAIKNHTKLHIFGAVNNKFNNVTCLYICKQSSWDASKSKHRSKSKASK